MEAIKEYAGGMAVVAAMLAVLTLLANVKYDGKKGIINILGDVATIHSENYDGYDRATEKFSSIISAETVTVAYDRTGQIRTGAELDILNYFLISDGINTVRADESADTAAEVLYIEDGLGRVATDGSRVTFENEGFCTVCIRITDKENRQSVIKTVVPVTRSI